MGLTNAAIRAIPKQKALYKVWKSLGKVPENRLYRQASSLSRLRHRPIEPPSQAFQELGWDLRNEGFINHPDLMDLPSTSTTYPELPGLYWGSTPKEAVQGIWGDPHSIFNLKTEDLNVVGRMLPGARVKTYDADEWRKLVRFYQRKMPSASPKEISESIYLSLRPKYDFIRHPDVALGNDELYQTIQINPKKTVAMVTEKEVDPTRVPKSLRQRYKDRIVDDLPRKDVKRRRMMLLSATGAAVTAGAAGQPDTAEAMPLGKLYKAGSKIAQAAVKAEDSSAARRLTGKVLQGKVIQAVKAGKGDWRSIIFDDGTVQVATKDYINDLARHHGTTEYLTKFEAASKTEQMQQALRSLELREARSRPFVTRDTVRKFQKSHIKRLDELDVDINDTVMVLRGKKYFPMPRVYAELLERTGIVQIIKGTREQRLFKKAKVRK